jgi:hypothetical protein
MKNKPHIPRLGIDIGRVLIAAEGADGADTAFIGGSLSDALDTPPYEGMFDAVAPLVDRFEGRVWLVSKCGPSVQAKSRAWLRHHRFFERTGMAPANLRFCLQRPQKADHCRELQHHALHRRPQRRAAASRKASCRTATCSARSASR